MANVQKLTSAVCKSFSIVQLGSPLSRHAPLGTKRLVKPSDIPCSWTDGVCRTHVNDLLLKDSLPTVRKIPHANSDALGFWLGGQWKIKICSPAFSSSGMLGSDPGCISSKAFQHILLNWNKHLPSLQSRKLPSLVNIQPSLNNSLSGWGGMFQYLGNQIIEWITCGSQTFH